MLDGYEIKVSFKKADEDANIIDHLRDCFQQVVDYLKRDYHPDDYMGISVNSEEFSKGEAWQHFRLLKDFDADDIAILYSLAQSNDKIDLTGPLEISCNFVRNISGGCKNYDEFKGNLNNDKHSIINISITDDNYCLARSLVIAEAYLDRGLLRQGTLHSY